MRTPSNRSRPLLEFIDLRESLRFSRIGHGGLDVCRALSKSLDDAIADLIPDGGDSVAIVAIGGYGRGELSPHSDVDLMLLHDLDDASMASADLFRPLWDAKLRVGHSSRTVKEAARAARERFDTHTTLLTSRLVAGSTDLFTKLLEEVASVTSARPLRSHLVSAESDRRNSSPYLLMATDVKNGRGGLRTLQGFEWERRREALIGRFSSETQPEEIDAMETLLRVRNGLHIVTGRAHDTFSVDLREPVARWLGTDVLDISSDLVRALQSVDGLATRRWPEVIEPPRRTVGRRVWSRVSSGSDRPKAARSPSPAEFMWILENGELGRLEFGRLWDGGHFGELLPEWAVVSPLPHLAPFHIHPVASHTWRTVDEMRQLVAGEDEIGAIAATLDDPDILLLAAFLHDIGKGQGDDHSIAGASIAVSFCERIGIAGVGARLVESAVRLHLLLPRVATRRDLDDPAVIEEVAVTIGSIDLLRILYLLAIADSKATGPTMWSEWKATLLKVLYTRCSDFLSVGQPDPAAAATTVGEVLALVGHDRENEVSSHLVTMPEEYLRSASAADVLWHLDLIAALDGHSNLGIRADFPHESAVVVGGDRPGFRRLVAEVFAANGIDVLEARLMGRSDGLIVDSFRVRDDRTGTHVPAERWKTVGGDIEAALRGDLDTRSKMIARAAAYATPPDSERKPSAISSIDAASGDLLVTVKCSDRIGRLAEILAVFNECGLEIRLAKLDSRESEVVDTFHVEIDESFDTTEMLEILLRRISSAISP
ncbi:MAG: HD domain-containing protein [Acidimicrobiia bacterium]